MRTIKFRAWDKDTMVYFDLDDEVQAMGRPIMQFTGLLDKNGKEIYEGDIVRFFREGNGHVQREIKWDERKGHYFLLGPGALDFNPYYELFDELRSVEVLGNIYENPSLLNS